jgi:hypothetical protein
MNANVTTKPTIAHGHPAAAVDSRFPVSRE